MLEFHPESRTFIFIPRSRLYCFLGRRCMDTQQPHQELLTRARMRRPWFSSGEGERLGIVIWPPNLFELEAVDVQQDSIKQLAPGRDALSLLTLPDDGSSIRELQDADLGPGGPWVTRWGADPIRPGYPVQGWLMSRANFPNAKVVKPCVRCGIPNVDQATGRAFDAPGDTLSTYRSNPRFDGGITFGQNAIVTSGAGGVLRVGDELSARLGF